MLGPSGNLVARDLPAIRREKQHAGIGGAFHLLIRCGSVALRHDAARRGNREWTLATDRRRPGRRHGRSGVSHRPGFGGDSPLRAILYMSLAGSLFPLLTASVKYLGARYPIPEIFW